MLQSMTLSEAIVAAVEGGPPASDEKKRARTGVGQTAEEPVAATLEKCGLAKEVAVAIAALLAHHLLELAELSQLDDDLWNLLEANQPLGVKAGLRKIRGLPVPDARK